MTKHEQEEPGFSNRQIKQIAEVVGQVVERVVEPHFAAVQSVLVDHGELLDKHTQQLDALQEDVSDIKDDIASIKKRQNEEQHSIDRHDRELATLKH